MKSQRTALTLGLVMGLVTGLLSLKPVLAQTRDLGEIHGLKLGLEAEDMETEGWGEFACGSNGGPPRQVIDDWRDFKKCRPEANGLYEVYVRFDDQTEYVGRAVDDPTIATNRTGTRIAGHPVVLSALFDKDGILQVIRFVSDPRGDPAARRVAYLLRLVVINRYDPADWTCKDIPPAEGETPVGGIFLNSHCEKSLDPQRSIIVDGKFFRKPGQSDIDPVTREYKPGQFESSTRVEIYNPAIRKP